MQVFHMECLKKFLYKKQYIIRIIFLYFVFVIIIIIIRTLFNYHGYNGIILNDDIRRGASLTFVYKQIYYAFFTFNNIFTCLAIAFKINLDP